MSSNNFNCINQYRYPQDGISQQPATTNCRSQPGTSACYQQTPTAVETEMFSQHYQPPAQSHAQTQTQSNAPYSTPTYARGHGQSTQTGQLSIERPGMSSPALIASQDQKQ